MRMHSRALAQFASSANDAKSLRGCPPMNANNSFKSLVAAVEMLLTLREMS